MLDSCGRRSLIARRTVSPPVPESRTPIGRWSPATGEPILLGVVGGRAQTVAETGHRFDRDPGLAMRLQLLAQALDVRVDRVVVDIGEVAPHLLQQLGAGEHPA